MLFIQNMHDMGSEISALRNIWTLYGSYLLFQKLLPRLSFLLAGLIFLGQFCEILLMYVVSWNLKTPGVWTCRSTWCLYGFLHPWIPWLIYIHLHKEPRPMLASQTLEPIAGDPRDSMSPSVRTISAIEEPLVPHRSHAGFFNLTFLLAWRCRWLRYDIVPLA